MKILIISHYYWPENFKINDISYNLAKKGNEISILTGKPNYPIGSYYNGYNFFNKNFEKFNDINIHRVPVITRGSGSSTRLILNWISFAFLAVFRILTINEKYDKIFVFQPSPFTVAIPALVASFKFNAKIFFWVQDIWPETLSAAGGVNNKLLLSLVNWFVVFTYNRCDKVFVQSKAFISKIIDQGISKSKIFYLPNTTEKFYKPLTLKKKISLLPEGFKIMFAGNMGEAQNLEMIIDVAETLVNKKVDVKWVMIGDGRKKIDLIKKIKEKRLTNVFFFLGAFESEKMPVFFSYADLLLVSLKKDPIFSLTIPSKVQSYMACGKPILASLEGEGKRVIEEARCGLVAEPNNSQQLTHQILKFKSLSKEERLEMGKNARKYFENEFESEKQINKLIDLLGN